MRVKNIKDFKKLKRKYSGFYVHVKVKRGNGGNVSGYIAPLELELDILGYLGFLKNNNNYLIIIKDDMSCSYLTAQIIDRIELDTSKVRPFVTK